MSALVAPLVAPLLALGGLAALAFSMRRHHRDLLGHMPSRPRALLLRAIGWICIGLSLRACAAEAGWDIGPVLWFGLLTASALAIALLLAAQQSAEWAPRGRGRKVPRRDGGEPQSETSGRNCG